MKVKTLKRSILQRLFGIPATSVASDPGAWTYSGGRLEIALARTPELEKSGGAIRLEGKGMPERVLVVHGEDGNYYAFQNRCRHMGRRLDPVPQTATVQCCSIGKATYNYDGKVLAGPAKEAVKTYNLQVREGKLIITLGTTDETALV
jgi:nitrite reductase/ring-hydroxylating ferredoxin subunit